MKTLLLSFVTLALAVGAQSPQQAGPRPETKSKLAAAPVPYDSSAAVHADFVKRFITTPGSGLSRVMVPEFYRPTPNLELHGQPFIVRAPDLLGLEDSGVPTGYSPKVHLITRADVTNRTARALMKKRSLTVFETNAVKALRADRELIIVTGKERKPDEPMLVLGALRATGDCMKCHECAAGTLLGAFSYTLLPAPAQPADPRGVTNRIAPALLSRY